jgi:predicted nucleic acid-binding protein
LEYLEEIGSFYIATNTTIRLRDPDDSPFLEVAAVSGADFLITGNSRHYPRKIKTTKVVTPRDFLVIRA